MSPGARQFETTLWHLVLSAKDRQDPRGSEALARLCEIYWYPLYAYARRSGLDPVTAEDAIQDLFLRFLKQDFLANVQPDHGRFRSFLLRSLANLLVDLHKRDHARKRGAGSALVSLDGMEAEQRYRVEPVEIHQPDKLYDRRWVMTLLARTLDKLQADYHKDELSRGVFAELSGLLLESRTTDSYEAIGRRLGLSESAVKMQALRLRRRFQLKFREEVAQTLADPDQIEAEIAELLAIFA